MLSGFVLKASNVLKNLTIFLYTIEKGYKKNIVKLFSGKFCRNTEIYSKSAMSLRTSSLSKN